jgi:pantoate--beta-alanine ligase
MPDCALFGEKDLQQLMIIRRMVDDLCIPIEIIGHPIIRESDGLAMSSRNSYLSDEERAIAPAIYEILKSAKLLVADDNADFRRIEDDAVNRLRESGFNPEYFTVRRSRDLAEAQVHEKELSILVAAWLGNARLIDNIQVSLNA